MSSRFNTSCHIPYQPINSARKTELCRIMAAGNIPLAQKHANAQKRQPVGQQRSYDLNHFRKMLYEVIKSRPAVVTLDGETFTKEEIDKIKAVKRAEYEILAGHSPLISKIAIAWFKRTADIHSLEYADFYNEGIAAGIHAIYSYDKTENQFSTYLTFAVKNRFSRFMNKYKPLSHLPNSAVELHQRYKEVADKMPPETSFEQIAMVMKLSDEEYKTLTCIFRQTSNQSDVDFFKANKLKEIRDYTQFGKQFNQFDFSIEFKEIISLVQFTDWELKVLEAFMNAPYQSNGWKLEVANNNINPATGKPYSHQAPAVAMERIKAKLTKYFVNTPKKAA